MTAPFLVLDRPTLREFEPGVEPGRAAARAADVVEGVDVTDLADLANLAKPVTLAKPANAANAANELAFPRRTSAHNRSTRRKPAQCSSRPNP